MEQLSEDESEKVKFMNFLKHYDLAKHHESFVKKLGVHKVSHLKHTKDEDLKEIGLTRPEIARLKQKMKENFSTVGKLKKKIRGKDHAFDDAHGDRRRSSMLLEGTHHEQLSAMESPIVIGSGQITLLDKIGEGSHGSVHEADVNLKEGKLRVAAKCVTALEESAIVQFMKEAESMVQLNHPHIIKLYGISIGVPLMIIEELAPLGNLNAYLKANIDRIHLGNLYTFVIQIASAMCYLEDKRLVHRDLATRNMLVSTPDLVKLGDFGLARKLTELGNYQLTRNVPLPAAWMPPEAISNGMFSTASDVWSFGVLMWELYSKGDKPWEGYRGREIADQLEVGKHLDKPKICPQQVYKLMKSCWELRPTDRPSFAVLHKKLQEPQYRPEVGYVTRSHSVENDLYLKQADLLFVIDKYPRTNLGVGMTLEGEITTFKTDYVKMDFMRINKDLNTTDIPQQQQLEVTEPTNDKRRASTSTSNSTISSDNVIPSHYETSFNNPGAIEEETKNTIEGVYSTAEDPHDQQSHDNGQYEQLPHNNEAYDADDDDFYIEMRSPGTVVPPPINILDRPTEIDLPKPLSPTPTETTPQITPKTPRNVPKLDFNEPVIEDPPVGVASDTIDKESVYYYITQSQTSEPCNVSHDPPPVPPRTQKPLDESPPVLIPHPSPPKMHPSPLIPNPSPRPHPSPQKSPTVDSSDKESLFKVIFKEFPNTTRAKFYQLGEQCNWNLDDILDKLKIGQLMDMYFPYIEEKDCVRALEHCQGKVDRAAAWLIDLSETISARRTSHQEL